MEILNQARKNKNELNIQIYGQIGGFSWFDEPVSADQVYKELENFGNDIDTINLYINSPGGSVTEGCAIYSALKEHKAVKNSLHRWTMFIDSIGYSYGWRQNCYESSCNYDDTQPNYCISW